MKKNGVAALLVVAVAVGGIFSASTIPTAVQQSAQASRAEFIDPTSGDEFIEPTTGQRTEPKAPMAASQDGNNVYVVWWTNRSGNWEVMFRASNDGGQTFGERINLSNTPDTQSQTAEILAVGNNNVFVTWWESSPETESSESVLRVSTDGGQTFGPVTTLGTNGTITTTTDGGNSTTAATTTS